MLLHTTKDRINALHMLYKPEACSKPRVIPLQTNFLLRSTQFLPGNICHCVANIYVWPFRKTNKPVVADGVAR